MALKTTTHKLPLIDPRPNLEAGTSGNDSGTHTIIEISPEHPLVILLKYNAVKIDTHVKFK